MRGRYEARLESGRREVHTALEHCVEKSLESFGVALYDLGVSRRWRGAKIQPEHASYRLCRESYAAPARGRYKAIAQGACRRREPLVESASLQLAQGREPRRDC